MGNGTIDKGYYRQKEVKTFMEVTFMTNTSREWEELSKDIKEQVRIKIKILREERNKYIEYVEE